ncbi:Phosphatidyl-N-methylethanolamine N-methyltransferase [Kappamyces sp. JEL0829]|nr:Phosphatidyl-N-methylethanolamine N-methyltransferase [Kappamyces sp. JEL0829]
MAYQQILADIFSPEKLQVMNATYTTLLQDSVVAFHAIDFSKSSLWISAFSILFSPLYWNVVARNEYRNKTWRSVFGTKELACSVFSASVFTLGLVRDYVYTLAILDQPHGPEAFPLMACPEMVAFSYVITTIGAMFVFFSMKGLGIHGTYLGDYFGILKTERITDFPFNVVENPMYIGSTMCFLGTAVWHCSPTGIILSVWVFVTYMFFAVLFEEGFTNMIYSNAAKAKKID